VSCIVCSARLDGVQAVVDELDQLSTAERTRNTRRPIGLEDGAYRAYTSGSPPTNTVESPRLHCLFAQVYTWSRTPARATLRAIAMPMLPIPIILSRRAAFGVGFLDAKYTHRHFNQQ
jgi:hypothetical protein